MDNKCKYVLEHKVWDDYLGCMVTSYYCGAEKEPSPCDHLFTPSHCDILYPAVTCPRCESSRIDAAPMGENNIYWCSCLNCNTNFKYYRDGKKVWYCFL